MSVVEHDSSDHLLLVRARDRADLVELADYCELPDQAIETDKTADYWYRLVVKRVAFERFLARAVDEIDYRTNVKGALDKGDDRRHRWMMRCWEAGNDFMRGRDPKPLYAGQTALPIYDHDFDFDLETAAWDLLAALGKQGDIATLMGDDAASCAAGLARLIGYDDERD